LLSLLGLLNFLACQHVLTVCSVVCSSVYGVSSS